MKWALIILGVLILLSLITALFGDNSEDGESSVAPSPVTSAPADGESVAGDSPQQDSVAPAEQSEQSDQGEADLLIGETADLKGLLVTASGLRDEGVDVLGTNHICVDVAVDNGADKAFDVNQFDFNLTTPAGITVDSTFTGSSDLQTAKVNPGGKLGGTVCFESEALPGEYKVAYEPFFALRKAYWKGEL